MPGSVVVATGVFNEASISGKVDRLRGLTENIKKLYASLWSTILREPMALSPDDPDSAWHIDVSAAATDDDGTDVYLTYYADEEERRRWADEYPDDQLPEPKPLPFDRDRHLPSQWASPPAGVDDDARMS